MISKRGFGNTRRDARALWLSALAAGLLTACGVSSRTVHEGAAGAGGSSATAGASGGETGGAGTSVGGSSAGTNVAGDSAGEVGSAGTSAGGAGGSSAGGAGAGAGAGGVGGAPSVCGNGVVESGEACDDGNKAAGDGCDPTCAVEAGFACSGAPSACSRSCNGLAKTCGPGGSGDCCASSVVTGITTASFLRSFDGVTYTDNTSPALVSDFRLDTYEITVGRFRKFVAAYSQNMIAAGAGKNPNNPSDPGWETAWNASLDADSTALTTAVECAPAFQTYTAGEDNLPMNCLDWFEAEAFCIWDGGRLPTEAEWNYAAAGGIEQRIYPWGSAAPGANANLAVYGCYYNGTGSCSGAANFAPVGSVSAGSGKWGQADLAGNVWEWVQDWYVSPYSNTACDNCADLTQSGTRVLRGGGFGDIASGVLASKRINTTPQSPHDDRGARCARSAP